MIAKHPAVHQIAMIGVPDKRLGEKSCACVVLRDGKSLTMPELNDFLLELGIAKFKLPEFLQILKALPMTPTGKVQKFKLKDDFLTLPN